MILLAIIASIGGSIFPWPPDLTFVTIGILAVAGYAGFDAGRNKPMSLDEAFAIVTKWGSELGAAQTPTESATRRRYAASLIMNLPLDRDYKSALQAAQIVG